MLTAGPVLPSRDDFGGEAKVMGLLGSLLGSPELVAGGNQLFHRTGMPRDRLFIHE